MTHRRVESELTNTGIRKYNDGTGLATYERKAILSLLGVTEEEWEEALHNLLVIVIPRYHGTRRINEEITCAGSLHEVTALSFPDVTDDRVFGAHVYTYCKFVKTTHTLPPT